MINEQMLTLAVGISTDDQGKFKQIREYPEITFEEQQIHETINIKLLTSALGHCADINMFGVYISKHIILLGGRGSKKNDFTS